MTLGRPVDDLFDNPNFHVGKTQDEIFEAVDQWKMEIFPGEIKDYKRLTTFVALPPLIHENKHIKGVLFTDGADVLSQSVPNLHEAFHVFGYSMWSSYSRSITPDGIFSCYANTERDAWWHRKYPSSKKLLIPCLDSDFVHEYLMTPRQVPTRDIDILFMSRVDKPKNVVMMAKTLKVLRKKYNKHKFMCTWVIGKKFGLNFEEFDDFEKGEWRAVNNELGFIPDYINLMPFVEYTDMPALYSRSDVYMLCSLHEGKNRGLLEAAMCDTPVVAFEDYNKYVRATDPAVPLNGGLAAPHFDPESMADTLFTVLQNRRQFKPRQSVIKDTGRRNTFNLLLRSHPYYAKNIPGFNDCDPYANLWLNEAMVRTHGYPLFAQLYRSEQVTSVRSQGLERIQETISALVNKFLR